MRRNVTVTAALGTAAFVTVLRIVTVSAGLQPPPEVSDVLEVALTKLRGATVVVVGAVVVVGRTVVVVVGAAVVVVVGGIVVVVVVLTEVVLDDPPGIDVPVGPLPSIVGNEPMRLLVSS